MDINDVIFNNRSICDKQMPECIAVTKSICKISTYNSISVNQYFLANSGSPAANLLADPEGGYGIFNQSPFEF